MNEFERPKNDCPAVGYQEVDVCVPVTVKPFANVLTPKIKHVGTPVVCAGEGECRGGCGNICKFTISQKIKVDIPVIFGAKAEVGAAAIDCEGVGVDKHEANCCK